MSFTKQLAASAVLPCTDGIDSLFIDRVTTMVFFFLLGLFKGVIEDETVTVDAVSFFYENFDFMTFIHEIETLFFVWSRACV